MSVAGVGLSGQHRDNSFDGVRLLAAVAVVVGHAFVLTGHGPAPKVGGLPLHAMGVDAFFVLSGWLVTESWLRDPHVARFLARRVLRIFPALAVVVLVTVLVVGPMVTTFGAGAYFASPSTWAYLGNLVLVGVYPLPGVFAHGHWTSAVNGCFWTLGLEFIGYGVVALALRRRWPVMTLVLLLVAIGLVVRFGPDDGLGAAGRVWLYFAIGSLARRFVRPRWLNIRAALPLLAAWLVLGWRLPHVAEATSWVVLPFVVLALGLAPVPILRRAARFGDLSYGVYLWGFLVQQLVIERFGTLVPLVDIPVVLLPTLAIALLSWRVVEAPALLHKPRPTAPVRTRDGVLAVG